MSMSIRTTLGLIFSLVALSATEQIRAFWDRNILKDLHAAARLTAWAGNLRAREEGRARETHRTYHA
jgi:hypothetical protein